MNKCIKCGSFAINSHLHGRQPDVDLDLCDVCYWRKRALPDSFKITKWEHLKTGNIYSVISTKATPATNHRDDGPLEAVYFNDKGQLFTREYLEFRKKFAPKGGGKA